MQFHSTSDPKIRFTKRRKNFFLPKGLGKHHLGHLDSVCCPKWVSNSTTCHSTVILKSTTVVHSNASGLCEDADPQGGSYSTITKTCHRRSQDMSPKTGLLQSNLPSEEEVRRVETSHRLNKFVHCPHFKMETLDTVRMSLQKGDWATSLDLRDAYFHIPIHRKSRRYLRFFFKGKIYQFRALPFGLSVSPYVFSRVLKAVLRHVRRLGIRVHTYLDDWLQLSVSEVQSWQHSRRLLNIILELGFVPNWEKSELVPTQKFCFLGARFNLIKGQVGPSLERISTFQQALTLLLNARQASARQLHSIVGQMESMANLLPWGRLHKRSLQWGIKERWSQEDCL